MLPQLVTVQRSSKQHGSHCPHHTDFPLLQAPSHMVSWEFMFMSEERGMVFIGADFPVTIPVLMLSSPILGMISGS